VVVTDIVDADVELDIAELDVVACAVVLELAVDVPPPIFVVDPPPPPVVCPPVGGPDEPIDGVMAWVV
jgi:hypothetical protein